MTLEEEIQNQQEKALGYKIIGNQISANASTEQRIMAKECYDMSEHHRQIAEWLKELKEQREIQDILLQFLADDELDICCDELAEDEEEWEICGKNCNNHTKECWIRWAKMKAREVNDVNT